MKTKTELLTELQLDYDETGYFYRSCRYYNVLISTIGDIKVEVEVKDYSGDTWLLLEKDGKFGYLSYGWGSCSGCDRLQACETPEDIMQLRDYLDSSVKWFDDASEALSFINNHDWVGDYGAYYEEEQATFVFAAKQFLSNIK